MAVKKQNFMNGVLVIMVSQILIKVFGFIYRVIITNFKEFSDTGNSYYGSGFTVYTLILAIATMGIPNTISKLVSEKIAIGDKRGAHRIFRTAMYLFTFVGVMFALMLFLGSGFISNTVLSNPGVKYTLMALAPAIIFVAMSAVLRGYFVGMGSMMEYSKAQVIEQIVNSVFSIIFVVMLLNSTPEIMAAGSTLATTVATSTAFFYMLIYYNKNKKDIWKDISSSDKFALIPRKTIVKKLISYVIPISFGSVVVALSNVIDTVTVMKGLQTFGLSLEEANKQFGMLLGKVDILMSVPLSINVAFSVALVPFISSALAKKDKKAAVDKINFSIKTSVLIALPCAVGMFLLANNIFSLIFPNASEGAWLLQIQCWVLVFSVVAQTLYGALQGFGKLYIPGICLLTGAVVKYILNVIFIPKYGIVVPTITTIVYQAITCILSFIILFKTIKKTPNIKELFLKPLMATIFMGIFTFLCSKLISYINLPNTVSTIILIMLAILVYIAVVVYFNVLNYDEIKQLPYGNKICKLLKKNKKLPKMFKK